MPRTKPKVPINPDIIVDPRTVPFSDPAFRGVLPHIEKPGCSYFVTYCLADVAPARALRRKQALESSDPSRVAAESDFEPTVGSCILRDPDLAAVVEDSLLHFQGERYALSAWCVMPNHVHLVVTPFGERRLFKILQSWKSFSAHEINRRLGRQGHVWQKESFDHIVRNAEGFEKFAIYTEMNPVVAGLVSNPNDWPFSSARHRTPL